MKTTISGGGSVIPKVIAADLEADWRSLLLKESPYRSIATTDGGTMWTGTTTSSSTTFSGAAVGPGWSSGTYTATTGWTYVPVVEEKPARLTKAQKAMVMDAIAEQLVSPPKGYRFIPFTHGTITPYDEL